MRLRVSVDTREKVPLEFKRFDVEIVREALKLGDYGAATLTNGEQLAMIPVFFQRKGLPDLFGTLTNEKRHSLLRDQCLMAIEVRAKLILAIEGTDEDVLNGFAYSDVPGTTVMKAITTMWFRYDLIPMLCASRDVMEWRMMNIWKTWERLSAGNRPQGSQDHP